LVQSHARPMTVSRSGGPRGAGVVLEGGTLTSSAGPRFVGSQYCSSLARGVDRSPRREDRSVGTLLGPEGAGTLSRSGPP